MNSDIVYTIIAYKRRLPKSLFSILKTRWTGTEFNFCLYSTLLESNRIANLFSSFYIRMTYYVFLLKNWKNEKPISGHEWYDHQIDPVIRSKGPDRIL